jgi:hypothetical protein
MNIPASPGGRSTDLFSELRRGRVVLFTGAGISLGTHGQMGLPSASELTREMALQSDFCRAGRCWNFDGAREFCAWDTGCVNDYPRVAEHYAELFGRPALVQCLRDQIELPGLRPLLTHAAIAQLPISVIVTTNWDRLVEDALREQGKRVATIVENYEVAFSNYGDVLLVKMHGSIDRPQSIIATERDYDEFFGRLPGLVDMLLYFFATRTFLFVGYSLSDANFKRLYLQVTRHMHDRYGHLFRHTAFAVQLNSSEYDRRFWAHQNLRIIDEDATVFLETLLAALHQNPASEQRRT